ncbi:hypothetical protein [Polyangium jinanense]|uniref:Uncharacterized protein n=1 Tax=Polyangium jinanense TaxID=2829994 RepID=A0A9X3XDZ9_9BACT|nr:hypothetical protein [Polyangium jinanense]MDC3960625.1 hypothetical protein [Polyangium jinanense]MDC3986913.1 hypothetical protein [Polyangium jinanense]
MSVKRGAPSLDGGGGQLGRPKPLLIGGPAGARSLGRSGATDGGGGVVRRGGVCMPEPRRDRPDDP